MISVVWGVMVVSGLLYGMIAGNPAAMTSAMMDGAGEALALVLKMAGGFMLWNGMFEILKQAGIAEKLARAIKPLFGKLFPEIRQDETISLMTMNLTMNMLGLGNAATPMGLNAMKKMREEMPGGDTASNAMCMFLVINASSIQLIPTTIMTLRQAAGSTAPEAILLPTLAATAASTITGILMCLILKKRGRDG